MRFESEDHPGGARPASHVYASALVRPIAAVMLPLMIVITVVVLQYGVVWPLVSWSVPTALILATAWTHYRLSSRVVEIDVRGSVVDVRTVSDVMHNRPSRWDPVFDVRATQTRVEFSAGWTTYELQQSRWPQADALVTALRSARDEQNAARTAPTPPAPASS